MSMNDSQPNETLREWTESAPHWEKYSATIRTMFAPVTAALIKDAGIREGQTVLDIAGGPGEPSLTIAETVGATGKVMCTDAVAEMVQAAEREAKRRGTTNISFRQCSADSLPFSDDSFDVTVSRLGAMFFPDPLAAMHEMLRVTKVGGRLALAVWQKTEQNPFFNIVSEVMTHHVESPPADPDAPGAFRFAEPGKLVNILKKAGAVHVRERTLEFQIEAPISADEFWELRAATSGTLRQKLASLSEAQANRVGQDVITATRQFFSTGQMSFPAETIIVSARKR
jgi:ubiquinone/menaquinone biosynthesis C-methylase UbiE